MNRIFKAAMNVVFAGWLGLASCVGAQGAVFVSDNFNRPDGIVGNGWTTWYGPTINTGVISIVSGQLSTVGYPNYAGGVYRQQAVAFPLRFSFDFRSVSTDLSNQGWYISFNTPASSLPANRGAMGGAAQMAFMHFAGTRQMIRLWQTATGVADEALPIQPGQRAYSTTTPVRVAGVVNADLSATITETYSDGVSPETVTYTFAPASNPIASATGNYFLLGNSVIAGGPHYFDNLVVEELPPAQLIGSVTAGVEQLVASEILTATEAGALTASLEAAQAKLAAGQPKPAENQLEAFVNKVQALVNSGRISATDGGALIGAVQQVIDRI